MKDINFLVNETALEKDETDKEAKKVSAAKVLLAVLCVTLAVALLLIPGIYVRYLEKQIVKVEDSLNDIKFREVRNTKAKLSQVSASVDTKKIIINGIDSKSVSASQILMMIEHALPTGCYFFHVNFDGSTLSLSGKSDSSILAGELIGNLDRLHLFTRTTQDIKIEKAQSPINFDVRYTVSEKGGK